MSRDLCSGSEVDAIRGGGCLVRFTCVFYWGKVEHLGSNLNREHVHVYADYVYGQVDDDVIVPRCNSVHVIVMRPQRVDFCIHLLLVF